LCGAGLLDAERALLAVPDAIPTAAAAAEPVAAPGTTVILDGTGSKALSGKSITTYQWTQTAGTPSVVLSNANTAMASFTAPATGTLTFQLRVTDTDAKSGVDAVTVRVNSAPTLAAPPAAQSAPVGSVVSFAVTGSDVDGDSLTFVATTGSTVPFTALSPSGLFVWSSAGYAPGTYQLVYFATDGVSQSDTQTVMIALAPAAGSGGGGALAWLQLLVLGAMLCVPAIRQRES